MILNRIITGITGIIYILGIFYILKNSFTPLNYIDNFSNRFEDFKETVKNITDKYSKPLINKNQKVYISNNNCFLNITHTFNYFDINGFTILVKPTQITLNNCLNLEEFKNNNFNFENKKMLNKYKIYSKNKNNEILIMNNNLSFCGNISNLNNNFYNISNFNINNYDENKHYNLSFYLDHKNEKMIFNNEYEFNICHLI